MTSALKPRVIFRADGGSKIGLGHVIRCLALAEILKEDFYLSFATQEPSPSVREQIVATCSELIMLDKQKDYKIDVEMFSKHLTPDDIVVLDGYHFKEEYHKLCKSKGKAVVCIDDLNNMHFIADAIISPGGEKQAEAFSRESYTQVYSGPAYALLRTPFLQAAKTQRHFHRADTLFINMGGADIHNITLKVLKAALLVPEIKNVNIVVGEINPHKNMIKQFAESISDGKINMYVNLSAEDICNVMKGSHIAICPSSGVSYEVCSVGLILLTGYTADNQKCFSEYLHKKNLAFSLGDLQKLTIKEMTNAIRLNINNVGIINNQKEIFNGNQFKNIKGIFIQLKQSQ